MRLASPLMFGVLFRRRFIQSCPTRRKVSPLQLALILVVYCRTGCSDRPRSAFIIRFWRISHYLRKRLVDLSSRRSVLRSEICERNKFLQNTAKLLGNPRAPECSILLRRLHRRNICVNSAPESFEQIIGGSFRCLSPRSLELIE